MSLADIIDGDSLVREQDISIIVEWRSARTLRSFVDAVRTLVTDAYIIFKRVEALGVADRQGHRLWENRFIDSVKVQAMDASHVSLVMAELDTVSFMGRPRVYTPDSETSIGMNLNQLGKALRCADDDDRVVLLSDSDPRVGRVYIFVYRPNESNINQSFLGDLYDEGTFGDVFHNGDPNRRLRARLKKRDVPLHLLPTKEMLFDLPKVFVDEPAIGVPPSPPGYTIRMPSKVFAEIARHLTSLADTLDISVFFERSSPTLDINENEEFVKGRHRVVFSSTYLPDMGGRHELRTKLRWLCMDEAMDMAEGDHGVIDVTGSPENDSDDIAWCNEDTGEKLHSQLLITLSFASRYLETFGGAADISETVQLHMNEDAPIQVQFIGDGLRMVYYLAPKIEE